LDYLITAGPQVLKDQIGYDRVIIYYIYGTAAGHPDRVGVRAVLAIPGGVSSSSQHKL
jgi:hypothetical protein